MAGLVHEDHVERLVGVPAVELVAAGLRRPHALLVFDVVEAQAPTAVDEVPGVAAHRVDLGVAGQRPERLDPGPLVPVDGRLPPQQLPLRPGIAAAWRRGRGSGCRSSRDRSAQRCGARDTLRPRLALLRPTLWATAEAALRGLPARRLRPGRGKGSPAGGVRDAVGLPGAGPFGRARPALRAHPRPARRGRGARRAPGRRRAVADLAGVRPRQPQRRPRPRRRQRPAPLRGAGAGRRRPDRVGRPRHVGGPRAWATRSCPR